MGTGRVRERVGGRVGGGGGRRGAGPRTIRAGSPGRPPGPRLGRGLGYPAHPRAANEPKVSDPIGSGADDRPALLPDGRTGPTTPGASDPSGPRPNPAGASGAGRRPPPKESTRGGSDAAPPAPGSGTTRRGGLPGDLRAAPGSPAAVDQAGAGALAPRWMMRERSAPTLIISSGTPICASRKRTKTFASRGRSSNRRIADRSSRHPGKVS